MKYMRNKFTKGFTLIELLAVIVILAIIALIATPRIMAAIEQARKEAFRNDVYGIVKAVERDYVKRILDEEKVEVTYEFNDYAQSVTPEHIDDLAFTGSGPKNGTIIVDEDGNIQIVLSDDNFCSRVGVNGEVILSDLSNDSCDSFVVSDYNDGFPYLAWETDFLSNQNYSEEQITDLIENHDYIPIASSAEFNHIRFDNDYLFGIGTIWEDTYTSGLDKNYIQVADIDLDEVSYSPIGESESFIGIYNGGNFLIDNLNSDDDLLSYYGLFSTTYDATLENIFLNVSIDSENGVDIGGLVAFADNTLIDNVHVSGEIFAGSGAVGGIAFAIEETTIKNSSFIGDISANDLYVGGIVAVTWWTSDYEEEPYNVISRCYVDANVKGLYIVGGIAGQINEGLIEESVVRGTVKADLGAVGGLLGSGWDASINNSYSMANIEYWESGLTSTSSRESFAGLVAALSDDYGSPETFITNSYSYGDVLIDDEYPYGTIAPFAAWTSENAYNNSSSIYFREGSAIREDNEMGASLSEEQFKIQSNFVGWDFDNIWAMN